MNQRGASGFTVVELLVVMSIISVLVALLFPAVQAARQSAQRIACAANLKQIALALHQYESNHGVFPPGSQVQDFTGRGSYSKSFGWTIALLPHLEQSGLYSTINTHLDAQIHNRESTNRRVAVYCCPSDPNSGVVDWIGKKADPVWGDYFAGGWGTNNYLGISGVNGWQETAQPTHCDTIATRADGIGIHAGMFYGNSAIRFADVLDGTSTTLFVAERGVTLGWGKWGGPGLVSKCPMGLTDVVLPGVVEGFEKTGGLRPASGVLDDRGFWWSWHPHGIHSSFVDGSVRFVPFEIERSVWFDYSNRGSSDSVW